MLGVTGNARQFTYTSAIGVEATTVSATDVQADTIKPLSEAKGLRIDATVPSTERYTLAKYHTSPFGGGSDLISGAGTVAYTSATNALTGTSTRFQELFGSGDIVVVGTEAFVVVSATTENDATVVDSASGNIGATTWSHSVRTDPDFGVERSGGSSATVTAVDGGVSILCGSIGDGITTFPKVTSAWGATSWSTSSELIYETHITVPQYGIIWIGLSDLTNTDISSNPNALLFELISFQDSFWHILQNINSVDTVITTTIPVDLGAITVLRIVIDENRVGRCYINDTLVYTSDVLTDIALIPEIMCLNPGSTAEVVVAYTSISKKR